MTWWIVRLDDKGDVESFAVVNPPVLRKRELCVEALDEAEAVEKALRTRAARESLGRPVKGLCSCGRPSLRKDGFTCSKCSARQQLHARWREPEGDADRGEALPVADVAGAMVQYRLTTLAEVRAMWRDARTNWDFSQWLTRQIGSD